MSAIFTPRWTATHGITWVITVILVQWQHVFSLLVKWPQPQHAQKTIIQGLCLELGRFKVRWAEWIILYTEIVLSYFEIMQPICGHRNLRPPKIFDPLTTWLCYWPLSLIWSMNHRRIHKFMQTYLIISAINSLLKLSIAFVTILFQPIIPILNKWQNAWKCHGCILLISAY